MWLLLLLLFYGSRRKDLGHESPSPRTEANQAVHSGMPSMPHPANISSTLNHNSGLSPRRLTSRVKWTFAAIQVSCMWLTTYYLIIFGRRAANRSESGCSSMSTSTPLHTFGSMERGGASAVVPPSPLRLFRDDSVDGALSPVSTKSAATDTDTDARKKVTHLSCKLAECWSDVPYRATRGDRGSHCLYLRTYFCVQRLANQIRIWKVMLALNCKNGLTLLASQIWI